MSHDQMTLSICCYIYVPYLNAYFIDIISSNTLINIAGVNFGEAFLSTLSGLSDMKAHPYILEDLWCDYVHIDID